MEKIFAIVAFVIMGLTLVTMGILTIRKVYLMMHEITHTRIKARITKISDFQYGYGRDFYAEFNYNGKCLKRLVAQGKYSVGDIIYVYYSPKDNYKTPLVVEGQGYYWIGVLFIMMGCVPLIAAFVFTFPNLFIWFMMGIIDK